MENYENSAKIYTGSSCGELKISVNNTKQIISATNNRAKYYSDLAEKYKDEAKEYRDNAQYYAEQNSDVTYNYIDSVKNELNEKIAQKQDSGDYALKSEIPLNVSELINDMEYTTFDSVIPEQVGKEKQVLYTDGENLYWDTPSSYHLFDTKLSDYVLSYEESKGWALQGTYVYKEALVGSRYGYPDFYNKCLEEKDAGTVTEVTLGENTITLYVNLNGHQYYNISDKEAVDSWFNTYGSAWMYGIDAENERILLPRNNHFEQVTTDILEVGQSVDAGLPNAQGKALVYPAHDPSFENNAFTQYSGGGVVYGATDNRGESYGLSMDLSLANPIYGNSDTVQPNAVKKLLYICVGNITNYAGITEVVNQGMEILEQVNQGVESRLDTDVINITNEGKNSIIGWTLPDYSKGIEISFTSSGLNYTAPDDGYLSIQMLLSTRVTGYVNVNGVTALSGTSGSSSYFGQLDGQIVVRKGDLITATGNYDTENNHAYFYPMKGAN